jgi:hypothetical protein
MISKTGDTRISDDYISDDDDISDDDYISDDVAFNGFEDRRHTVSKTNGASSLASFRGGVRVEVSGIEVK